MNNNCHICNSETRFLLNKDDYPMFICKNCGLVFMNPLPIQDFLKKEVYSADSGYQGNKSKRLSETNPDKKTIDIISFLKKNNIKGKMLDVGCSNGEFLYHSKKEGFDVYGVELNERTANIAIDNGVNVYKGLLEDARFEDNFFDIVFLGDVIEHVLSPRDFIKECRRVLKSNGIIVISTPNLDCAWAKTTLSLYKTFGIPWSSVTPPYHTFQFSKGNLDLLMKDLSFVNISSWFYRPPRLMYELGSLHLLKKYKNNKNIKDLLFMLWSFKIYTILYIVIVGTRFFRRKDFSMISVYKKHE